MRDVYGEDRVCKVITYSTIKAKQAINDANRVLGFPVYMGQRLSKMLSNDPKLTLPNALHKNEKKPDQYSPDFEEAYNKDADAHRIIDAALSIEGFMRGEGVHACATLIAPTPVTDHVPTKLDTKGNVTITQYEGHSVADMGLLKMDFLGLRTLTVINKALENIRRSYPDLSRADELPEQVRSAIKPGATCVDLDVDKCDFSDPAIYELLGSGHTAGVFQVESAGMTATIKGMQPTEYKHIVALIALYRPGPLGAGMVTSYINRMNGKEPVVFYDDRLSDILDETYGTMVYQEQVMQISMKMSNFSPGESDGRIRKPVAKKKIKMLTSQVFHWEGDGADETIYDHWMNGALGNGYQRDVAQRIWDDVLEFASYAFNKSHSAGYAILVMQTAWLKSHFPREFMASVLTSYMGKTDKIVHYVTSCCREGIDVLPPDVNESGKDFTATPQGVRFGFAGIRGVGDGVGEAIMAERGAPSRASMTSASVSTAARQTAAWSRPSSSRVPSTRRVTHASSSWASSTRTTLPTSSTPPPSARRTRPTARSRCSTCLRTSPAPASRTTFPSLTPTTSGTATRSWPKSTRSSASTSPTTRCARMSMPSPRRVTTR